MYPHHHPTSARGHCCSRGFGRLHPSALAITIPVACSENALVAAVNLASFTLNTGVAFSRGNVLGDGGGIYNGLRDTLIVTGNTAGRGGISAVNATATTFTQTAVTNNHALVLLLGTSGGVYRPGGVMTTTNSPITANTPNNCVGSTPAVPNCTG
jgi:hypothetical protein